MLFRLIQLSVLMAFTVCPVSCQWLCGQIQTGPRNETIAGGLAGAIIGGIVGKQNDETPEGIAIGAALGALAGNAIGNDRNQLVAQQQAYQRAAYQQQLAHQQAQQQAFQKAATLQDVIEMSQNGIATSVIMNHLQKVGIRDEIGVPEIISLSRSGVDEQVIAMMQQMGPRQTSYAYPAPVQQVRPIYRTANAPTITIERFVPLPQPCPREARRRYDAYRPYQNHLEFHYRR